MLCRILHQSLGGSTSTLCYFLCSLYLILFLLFPLLLLKVAFPIFPLTEVARGFCVECISQEHDFSQHTDLGKVMLSLHSGVCSVWK